MTETIINPDRSLWSAILKRPTYDVASLYKKVQDILNEIRQNGEKALKGYTLQFEGLYLESFEVTKEELASAEKETGPELKNAIRMAAKNIEIFHSAQKPGLLNIETMPGINCRQKAVPIERVGLYIPGGTAPLFSTVLMLAIPAHVAGCKEIVLCTPSGKDGKVHPAILYAAKISDIQKIYKLGGIQAIGAMAYGIGPVPKVDKIFGPGNQYVTAAKQLVSKNDVAIDMPAGPSEVMVVADETANVAFVAADLLSQAEHGADSQVALVANSIELVEKVKKQVTNQLEKLPRKALAKKSLDNSIFIVMENGQDTIDLVNTYAPEHLILSVAGYNDMAEQVVNAGSVFLGNYTPESAGDYASGTNHTLPTNGWAKTYSGVNIDSFIKKITFQEISEKGLATIGPAIEIMADAEHLDAHKNAVTIRINKTEEK